MRDAFDRSAMRAPLRHREAERLARRLRRAENRMRPSELEPGLRDADPALPFETISIDGLLHRRLSLPLRIEIAVHAEDIVPRDRKR